MSLPTCTRRPAALLVPPPVIALSVAGCGTTTAQRAGSAGLFGAAIGSLSANAGAGALIGLGVGALGSYLSDQHLEGNID